MKLRHYSLLLFLSLMACGRFDSDAPPTKEWLSGSWVWIEGNCDSGEPYAFDPNGQWKSEFEEGAWSLSGRDLKLEVQRTFESGAIYEKENPDIYYIRITDFDDEGFTSIDTDNPKPPHKLQWKRCSYSEPAEAVAKDSRAVQLTTMKVPQIYGLPYSNARKTLINNGWFPVRKSNRGYDLTEGRVQALWNFGFQEIDDCAGTGLGNCLFLWGNANGQTLSVSTIGSEDGEIDYEKAKYVGKPDFSNMTVDSFNLEP